MPVYFGIDNTKDYKVSEAISSLGLNLLRASPSDLKVVCIPHLHQVAYGSYVRFLPAYLKAALKNVRIPVNDPFHPIDYSGSMFPITLGPIAFSYPKSIPDNIRSTLDALGYEDSVVMKQKILVVNTQDTGSIRKIAESGASRTTPAPHGSINIACLPVIAVIRKIFSVFLKMHQYPAFKDATHMSDLSLDLRETKGKRKLFASEIVVEEEPPRKKGPAAGTSESVIMDVDTEGNEEDNRISVALPNKLGLGWTEADDDFIEGNGIFFRFVDELANDDKHTMMRVLLDYFLGCLGPNRSEILTNIENIRTQWGVIAKTRLGRELTHMSLCIDIGLKCQARILPIFSEGVYEGCITEGWGFTVQVGNKGIYEPLKNADLRKDLDVLMRRGVILSNLKGILGVNSDQEGWESVSSFGQLRRLLREVDSNEEDRKKVLGLVSRLRLGEFLPLNESTLDNVFTRIATGDYTQFDVLNPHPSVLFSTDVIEVGLACFGILAPSFNFTGGPVVHLKGTIPTGPLSIAMVPLSQAVADLKLVIQEGRYCRAQGNRRSGPYKDRMFEGRKKQVIFSAIRKLAKVEGTLESTSTRQGGSAAGSSGNMFSDLF